MLEDMNKNFPILIVDKGVDGEYEEDRELREIIKHLEDFDYSVIKAQDLSDAQLVILSHEDIGCVLLSWNARAGDESSPQTPVEFIEFVRSRNPYVPIFLITEKLRIDEIPLEVVKQTTGYIWKGEDSPAFIAGRIKEAIEEYLNSLLPPFFKELARYVEEYKYVWHTPGHMGGVAFMKSPVGRIFFDFFGENVFRADLSVSVPELGSLMEHSGVVGDAERSAAEIFGADHTYFVTNGTSTANRIVFNGTVKPGDVVLVDRNCHKSIMYSIILTGAVPIYLMPTRNDYGIIGPIHMDEFKKEKILKKLKDNPFIKDETIKLAVITNSTYDGLCYNVEMIKNKLAGVVKFLHFDEAWYGYARFHPLYHGRYAMSPGVENPEHPILFATQSTHKVLAAFSQGSMIHIRQSHKRPQDRLDYELFNEAFMMHTSTSPQYNIIASLDVGAKMMESEAGKTLIMEALEEAILFRWKMAHLTAEIMEKESHEKQWWFKVWQPENIEINPGEQIHALQSSPDSGIFKEEVERWVLKCNDEWHGFEGIEKNYIMLDPLKVTILTPGIDEEGNMAERGIPASIVSRFLRNEGIVVEKTGFYSFLILFTIGITKGKSGTLLSALFKFKKYYDSNKPLKEVFPRLVEEYPQVYGDIGLRDLCDDMHSYLRKMNITKNTKEVYSKIPKMVMIPAEAYRHIVDGNVEKVHVANIVGRTAAVMIVPYPPGIPIWMPGEQLTDKTKSIRDYLMFYEDFDNKYPGFETEIHGIVIEENKGRKKYYIPCIKN